MRITILALGSRGDVLPFVALGKGLVRAGHSVCVATFENFAGLVSAHELDFHAVKGNSEDLLRSQSGLALAESGRNLVQSLRAIMASFGALASSYARDFTSPTLWETDLIINQLPSGLYGYDLAEKLNVPLIEGAVIPLVSTRTFPMLSFPTTFSRVPGYNALTYRIAEQIVWQMFRRAVNRWRKEQLGLDKSAFFGRNGQRESRRSALLNGFSPHVVPRPDDWSNNIYVTGYWFLDVEDWEPPRDLLEFLDSGQRPVLVGFGSMPIRDPERATRLALEALRRSGERAILLTGWAELGGEEVPDTVYLLDYAPFNWLFERVAAVVHHGGSGTTAAGLRAGVPSIIVPFVFDQFFWGQRVADLGIGPGPIPFGQLTAEALAEALGAVSQDSRYRRRATDLARKIRREDGIAKAIALIHDHV